MRELRQFLAGCCIVALVVGFVGMMLAPLDGGDFSGAVFGSGVIGVMVVYLLGVLEER